MTISKVAAASVAHAPPPPAPPSSDGGRLGLSRTLAAALPPFVPRLFGRGGSPPLRRPVRVPTVLQMEAVECGAASLAMVLAYFGRWMPLEELRISCGVSRDGSKASNIVKAARAAGLDAQGYRQEPAGLRSMPLPMILHWNFNHFVVLEGFTRKGALLNDPAAGRREVTCEELDGAFTGVALTFRPGPAFTRAGHPRSMLRSLRARLTGSELPLLFVVLSGLALVVPGLLAPSFSKIFFDEILLKGMINWAKPLLVVMGATAAMLAVLTWLQQHYLLRLETKFALDTSARFFWHVLRLPVRFFMQRFAGEIGARVALNDRIAQLLSEQVATNLLNVIMIVFYGLLMLQYDVVLTGVSVGIATLNLVALRYVSRRRADLNARLLQDHGKLIGTAMGGLQSIETLKATGSESDFFARWSGYQAKVVNGQQRMDVQATALSAVPVLLLAINTAALLGLGGARVMGGFLTIGMLMAFQALTMSFMSPIGRFVDLGSTLQEVRGDMDRLDDVLRAKPHLPPTPGAGAELSDDTPVKLEGALELRSVSFGYNPLDPPLIQDFNLSVRPGSRVALVGGSGSGKSTVARLVAGLYEPWSGEILFDGVPRPAVPRPLLTNSFTVVDQDIFLFEGTVKDNLTLWDDTIPESEVVGAGRDACIHEDVNARHGGYGSRVEEGGRNLSGGQRQRLEIARALVTNPSIILLDEATSALDPITEKEIDDHLRRRGCTCVIIAHRLSTIRDCDEIIVLERGRIVQRGTHDELRQLPGPYNRLIATE